MVAFVKSVGPQVDPGGDCLVTGALAKLRTLTDDDRKALAFLMTRTEDELAEAAWGFAYAGNWNEVFLCTIAAFLAGGKKAGVV